MTDTVTAVVEAAADPAGGRGLFLGQFRLTRLQVVNWGTFSGYKDIPIDERGVLFTGPSGSGKSSLMDAHSVVLLPTYDQRFNASADLTARGVKRATRSIADYVRGAWSETNDENHESRVRYLRAGRATWSAVAATYADGLGQVCTAAVVKWFTGTETDGAALHTMHQVHDGHFDLTALDEWATRGFDTRWFKATCPAPTALYPDSQTAYLRELARRVGLGTSRTALTLLGKAKAMKNVGDLNFFVRENMLDEPDTFDAARKMVEAFTPLNEAYQTARRAHAQERVLREVPQNWSRYRASRQTQTMAQSLLGTSMERYLRGVHLDAVTGALDDIDNAIAVLDQQIDDQQRRCEQALQRYRSLDAQVTHEGQALVGLEAELGTARQDLLAREQAYQAYQDLVRRVGVPCPDTEPEFTALRQRLGDIAEQARGDLNQLTPRLHELFATAGNTHLALTEKAAELTALGSASSLMPAREVRLRAAIAEGAGIAATELVYAAELIDVAEGAERWRPAAERMLRNYGRRLLVPTVHRQQVKRFIDEHDMRGVVEYSVVAAGSTRPPVPEGRTLAGKLTVDTAHPSGAWLAAQLVRAFDHVCVETADELDAHQRAVTLRGTVRAGGNHYRKDDRPELASPSSYILGANIAAKRAALQDEVAALTVAERDARRAADTAQDDHTELRSTVEAAEQLSAHASWARLDHWSAAAVVDQLVERIERLRADDVDLRELVERRDDAHETWLAAVRQQTELEGRLASRNDRQADLLDVLEREQGRPHTVEDPDEQTYLDEVLAAVAVDVPVTPESMPQVGHAFRKELERRRETADSERRLAHSKIKNAIDRFLEAWPDSAVDTSGDVERSGADFAVLHEDITQRRLPGAMRRFERLISDELVPSIGLVQRAIENAGNEIERRIAMVNAGLRRVEYNDDTHLQLVFKDHRPGEAADFRTQVDTLLREAPRTRRDPETLLRQFRRVQTLMAHFTADDPESRHWRTTVLDVRTNYVFYGREENAAGETTTTYRNTAANSGGEQEKLVAFCLAAALSYNLADADSDGRPRFAPLMLDEAFSKSDETFSHQALAAFEEFGFQLVIAAPIRMSGILEPFIGQAVLVDKKAFADGARSNAACATFGELVTRAEDPGS